MSRAHRDGHREEKLFRAVDARFAARFAFVARGVGFNTLGVLTAVNAEARIIEKLMAALDGFGDFSRSSRMDGSAW